MTGVSRRQAAKLLGAGLTGAGLIRAGAAGIAAPAVWAQSNMARLRVGVVPVLDAGAFFIAQANGHFARERLDVTVTPTPGGGPSMAAVVAGQLQISMSTVTTMIQSQQEGLNLRIVSGVSGARPFPDDYSGVMVRKDAGIRTGKDVAGKTGGCHLLQNLPWICTRLWIDGTGGDSSKASIIEVHFPQQEDALLGGRIDYVATNEPFMSATLSAHPDKLELVSGLMGTMLPNTIVAAFAASSDYIAKNKEIVETFARAYQSAADWAQANKKSPAMIEPVARFTKLPPERLQALTAWPEFIRTVEPSDFDRIAQAMKRYGALKDMPDTKALLYKTALG
jgi:NitT/TauT family transport system substrate-binding protein